MPRYFIPGGNSLNQSNIDTNNVCPCANDINQKIINGSNSTVLQNFTKVQKQTEIINYYLGGRIQFGNFSSRAAGIQAMQLQAAYKVSTDNTTNNATSATSATSATASTSSVNTSASASTNPTSATLALDLIDPNLYIRCVVPQKNAIKPLKNKF